MYCNSNAFMILYKKSKGDRMGNVFVGFRGTWISTLNFMVLLKDLSLELLILRMFPGNSVSFQVPHEPV